VSQNIADQNRSIIADWIEDSLHERDLRSKSLPVDPSSFSGRMSSLPGLFGYLYRALVTLGEEGEGWVVVTLVGKSTIKICKAVQEN
jgi:hypothetical protein